MTQCEVKNGFVLRSKDWNGTRFLTVLTADEGIITLIAKGAHSIHNPQMVISQPFVYANYEFSRKGDVCYLRGGSPEQIFHHIGESLEQLELASYFCRLTEEVTGEGVEAEEHLRLLLNIFFAMNRKLASLEMLKAVFEFRLAAISGYEPDLSCCSVCGKSEGNLLYLDVMNGCLICPDCLSKKQPEAGTYADEIRQASILIPLSLPVIFALRYILSAPLSKLLAFRLKEETDLHCFSHTAEVYVLSHLEYAPAPFQFYHPSKEQSAPKKDFELT